jgi:hypothetical protein
MEKTLILWVTLLLSHIVIFYLGLWLGVKGRKEKKEEN